MGDGQFDICVPQCSNVLWSELDKNLKHKKLSVITVNARSITGKFADLITNLHLHKKRFFYYYHGVLANRRI